MTKNVFFLLLVLMIEVSRGGLELKKGDRILFYGSSFIERLQGHGLFEASLQLAHPEKDLELRSLACAFVFYFEASFVLRIEINDFINLFTVAFVGEF